MRTIHLITLFAPLLFSCAKPPFAGWPDPIAALRTAGGGDEVPIVKSPLDQREYAYVELENGLRALLVSDPDTDMAAAALQVDVGHYADPADRQGLAHFLEHMLFMGTDQYPEVDEYRAFIESHGGHTNAGTGAETTSYFFEVEHEALLPAFDRFSRFFVAPLLDPAYVERERNAVHAEYTMKIREHERRIRQVRKATTHPDHPEAKFSVGNLDTLADRPGDPVHEDLLELYRKEYVPSRMTLAIIGREPIEVLRERVIQNLSPIAAREAADPARPAPFRDDQVGVRIHMVPLDDRRELEITFALPPQAPHWPAQPYDHITWLLGHEGEGTLFSALKERGWIERLSAYDYEVDDHALLTISADLTVAGLENVAKVEAAVFEAIALVAAEGVKASYHREQATMAELAFRYAEETPPASAVRTAAWALSEFPPGHVLDFSAQSRWKPDLVKQALAQLTPENARLILVAPGLETDQVEPLYSVPYAIHPLAEHEKAALVAGSPLEFGLPAPNPYIPEALALVPGGESPGVPARLELDDPRLEVWHLHDTSWGVPRAVVELRLYTPDPRADGVRSLVLHDLTTRLYEDALQEFAYPLRLAGLSFDFAPSSEGLTLTLSGYSDRMPRLMSDLGEAVRGFEVDAQRFEVVREAMVRDWRNIASSRPISQAHTYLADLLDPWRFDRLAAVPVAEALTVDDVRAYAGGLFDELDARLFVHGNVSADQAEQLAKVVRDDLLGEASDAARPERVTRRIPAGKELVRDVTIDHDDSTLVVAYQGSGATAADHARWRLLGQLIDTAFFTQLRTEQQLGYAVGAWYTTDDALPALRMSIQSAVAGPVTLERRVDAFVRDHRAAIAEMPPEAFEAVRNGVVASLRERPTRLDAQASRFRRDLYLGHHGFDFDEQVAREVEKLTREDVLALYDEALLGKQAGRLVVRSFGHAHAHEQASAKAGCATADCVVGSLTDTHVRAL